MKPCYFLTYFLPNGNMVETRIRPTMIESVSNVWKPEGDTHFHFTITMASGTTYPLAYESKSDAIKVWDEVCRAAFPTGS